MVFYLLWGAAALHPSMATADEDVKAGAAHTYAASRAHARHVRRSGRRLAGADDDQRQDRDRRVGDRPLRPRLAPDGRARAGAGSGRARVRALQETTDQLRHLDRMKDQFIATVSHELRTPLTSIHGYLDLLVEGEAGELTDEQRRFLSIAERNTDRLQRLVEDLLLVSELDAGKLKLELGSLDLRALAQESLESARPRAEAGGITLEFPVESPLQVTGDRVRLGQLLDNMISNAVKFTPHGGTVSVRTSRSNGSAVLEVEDTGMGIPAGEQEHLFDRFFRRRPRKRTPFREAASGSRSRRPSHRPTAASSTSPASRTPARPSAWSFRRTTRRTCEARPPHSRGGRSTRPPPYGRSPDRNARGSVSCEPVVAIELVT